LSSSGETKAEGEAIAEGGGAPSNRNKTPAEKEPGLARFLLETREQRGLTHEEIISETRIPAHYLQMIESSDYGLISDALYLLPFLRRYANFLGLDGEEIGMRFVREVQRAELTQQIRTSESFEQIDRKKIPWGVVALVALAVIALAALYAEIAHHRRHAPVPRSESWTADHYAAALPAQLAAPADTL